jgi:tetratricopeptide (TPR) repeat protein
MGYYRLGLCLLYKKELGEALNMFNKTISLNRANYDAYYYKGMCQRYLKYYEDAIITFNFFLNCFINNKSLSAKEISEEQIANVYYNKGRCLLSLGRYTEAIKMFTNYLKKNKDSFEVYFKRAVCYYNVQKYKKAVYDLSYIIQELKENENKKKEEKNKKRRKYKKRKINNYEGEDDDDDEDEEEEMETKKNIDDETEEIWAEIYFLRCKSYINLNKIDSGLKDINTFFDLVEAEKKKLKEEIRNSNKNNIDCKTIDSEVDKVILKKYDISEAHFKKGYCYLILLDYNLALKEFEKTIKLDPSYTTAYFNMGICLYNLNNKKDAIYFYQKVLNLNPWDIESFLNMVKCYREIGKPNYSYDILLKNTPIYLKEENTYKSRIPKLYYETAMSLLFLEKFDQAISYFDKCIEFETNKNNKNDVELLSECYYRKGFSLSKMNKKKEAINEFDEAIKYNDKNADIHNYKAHCLMILGNYEQAIESYVASINLNNKKFSTINDGNFSIGYCYTKMNKYEDALKYFEISKNINETEIKNMYLKGIESCEDGKAEESLIKMHLKYKDFSEKLIDLNYYKGICNMELGNYEEAIKNFDSCNKFDKKFCESYYKKGILFSRQNRSNEAIEQFEKAIFYNNKVEEFKEALQKEKEKIEKNDKNDNISNDASTSAINANKESNKIEEKNKMDNDLYKKQESYNIKEKDENVMEEKKEDIKEENDIRKSRTIKQRNSVIFKNKLISKSRNIGEINEERKEHNSTEGNNEIEMLLDESEEQVKKAKNDLGVARNESKTFIINDK